MTGYKSIPPWLPLHQLEHTLIMKAGAGDRTVKTDDKQTGVNRTRVGDYRAIIWEDADGQKWITEAGDRKDIFDDFNSRGQSVFEAEPVDRNRIKAENICGGRQTWRQQTSERARSAFEQAGLLTPEKGKSSTYLSLPTEVDGVEDKDKTVEFDVIVDIEPEGTVVLFIELSIEGYLASLLEDDIRTRFAPIVMGALGLTQDKQPDPHLGRAPKYTYGFVIELTEADLTQIRSAEARGDVPSSRTKAHMVEGGKSRMVQSQIDGTALRGLCGEWVVPVGNTEGTPVCKLCDAFCS